MLHEIGFNHQIITELLRGTYGYRGVVVSDWGITANFSEACRIGVPSQQVDQIAMPWGVEHLSRVEKVVKGVLAGIDQFGGENDPSALLEAIRTGWITEDRVNESAERILLQKFELGLFDNPFVDPERAAEIVGCEEFRQAGVAAQRNSVTLLKGKSGPAFPEGAQVYVHGLSPDSFARAGLVPVALDDADIAVVGLGSPHQLLHPNHFFGRMQHEGDLDFKDDDPDLIAFRAVAVRVPTVVVVQLDRPAVLTNVVDEAVAVYAIYGLSHAALVDVLLGDSAPTGRLPFQLPSSMDSVLSQHCDQANDLVDALFPIGYSALDSSNDISAARSSVSP